MYKIRFLKSETRKYLQFQLIIHKVSALRIGTYLQKQNWLFYIAWPHFKKEIITKS